MSIPMTQCASSAITAHGYDATNKMLAITYRGGTTYHYSNVPAAAYARLQSARSIGKFVTTSIVGSYEATKQKPPHQRQNPSR